MKGVQKLDEDPFASMIKLCLPTDSQEIELQFCPMARESENFEDTISSSTELTPSQPTPILMISQSDSAGEEDVAVFHTPPEHHNRSTSSSEQNFGDAFAELKKSRVYERGSEDEAESKTLMIGGETEGNESAGDTQIVELDCLDSDETVNLDSDTVVVGKVDAVFPGAGGGELLKGAVHEKHELRMNCEIMEDVKVSKEKNHYASSVALKLSEIEEETAKVKSITTDEYYEMKDQNIVGGFKKIVEDKQTDENGGDVNKGEKHCENSDSDEIAAITTIDEEIVKLMCTAADWCHKPSIVPECEEVVKVSEVGKLSINTNADGNVDVIDKFMYARGCGIKRRWKARMVRDSEVSAGKRCKSPVSLEKNEKKVRGSDVAEKAVETKNGILDFLDVLKEVFEYVDCGSENIDFLETAKKRGVTFPRPRWWPPESFYE